DAGGASDVVLIRVLYNYPVMTPLMGSMLATISTDNTRRLVSTVVLQTEPYE
ncbi:MAG: pilus assembly protein, partial [Micavibrio aeruginosavorus]